MAFCISFPVLSKSLYEESAVPYGPSCCCCCRWICARPKFKFWNCAFTSSTWWSTFLRIPSPTCAHSPLAFVCRHRVCAHSARPISQRGKCSAQLSGIVPWPAQHTNLFASMGTYLCKRSTRKKIGSIIILQIRGIISLAFSNLVEVLNGRDWTCRSKQRWHRRSSSSSIWLTFPRLWRSVCLENRRNTIKVTHQ